MKEALGFLMVILGLVVVILFSCARVNDSESNRAYALAAAERARGEARAMVIEAQAESRLHAAQAGAITQAASLPYAVLGVSAVAALVIFIGAMMVLVYLRQTAPHPRYIETRTIILLPPGTSRREFWRLMSEANSVKMLEDEVKR